MLSKRRHSPSKPPCYLSQDRLHGPPVQPRKALSWPLPSVNTQFFWWDFFTRSWGSNFLKIKEQIKNMSRLSSEDFFKINCPGRYTPPPLQPTALGLGGWKMDYLGGELNRTCDSTHWSDNFLRTKWKFQNSLGEVKMNRMSFNLQPLPPINLWHSGGEGGGKRFGASSSVMLF